MCLLSLLYHPVAQDEAFFADDTVEKVAEVLGGDA